MPPPGRVGRVQLHEAQLQQWLTGSTGVVTTYVTKKTRQTRNKAVLYCPVDTGRLRNSITDGVTVVGTAVTGRVGSAVDYALPVHEGLTDRDVNVRTYTATSRLGKTYTVRAHTRHQKARPGRPFLRTALEEAMATP